MKEQVGKKGPTVTRNIILDYENVKIYPYNRDHVVFEKKFNFSEKQCLKTVTTLLKPKKVGIEIKKKGKRINIWQVIKNLRNLEKKSIQSQQAMLLARIPMQSSNMTLHTDTSVVYDHKKAAPVSYIVNGKESSTSVDLTKSFSTYALQQSVYQTWNANTSITPDSIISQQQFTRPLVTLDSRQAVNKLKQLNQGSSIKIVGSYMANKIPLLDAAVESSVDIAQQLGCDIPWIKSNKPAAV